MPQLENGYARIANATLENLAKIRVPGESGQILYFIFRKTYGFQKKKDRISLSQFCRGTGIKRPNVCRAIKKLLFMNLIIKIDTALGEVYEFQKDPKRWVPLSKKIPPQQVKSLSKRIISVIQMDNRGVSKKIHTKDNYTKDNTKDIATPSVASVEIAEILDAFKAVNPSYKKYFSNKTHRACAERLIKEHGKETILSIISFLPRSNADKYAPTITNAYELEEKLGKLKAWSDKIKSVKTKVIL